MPSRGLHRARSLSTARLIHSINQHHTGLTSAVQKIYVVFLPVLVFRYYLWALDPSRSCWNSQSKLVMEIVWSLCWGDSLKKREHTYNASARGDVFRAARHNKFKINARPQMENIDKQPLRPAVGTARFMRSNHGTFLATNRRKHKHWPRRKSIAGKIFKILTYNQILRKQ